MSKQKNKNTKKKVENDTKKAYNSYFYLVEDETCSPVDKFIFDVSHQIHQNKKRF